MRVGVNAQLLGAGEGYRRTGVSRYIERLLAALPGALGPGDELRVLRAGGEGTVPDGEAGSGSPSPRRGLADRPAGRAAWEQAVLPARALGGRLDVLHGPVNVVPLLAPCRTVVTVHDLAYLRTPELVPAARRGYFGALTRLSVRRAARVLAVSASTKADVVELLGVPPERVTVTPLAADGSFRPVGGAKLEAFRAEQGIGRPFVLSVGTIEPRKNLSALLRAFDAVAPDVPHELVLVGPEGWMGGAFAAALAGLRHRDRVRLAGFAPAAALPTWYSAADLFAYPSRYEGFGLPPLEAMACGTPVVTSNVSSLPEVVGDAALTVDPLDEGALADALRRVLTEPGRAAGMRERGLRRAAEFSWERTAEATVGAYREAVG